MISRDQLLAFSVLILRWLPRHVVHLIARADVFLRRAVTIEAPFHVQGLGFARERHLIDPTVTGGAANPFRDVNAMVEINVVGQIMDTVPLQRSIGDKTGANRRERWRVVPNLRVTRHAGIGARHTGKGRLLNCRVTITAIDSVVAHVMFVTEGNRLIEGNVHVSGVRRPQNFRGEETTSRQEQQYSNNDHASMGIRACAKYLRHK